MVIHPSDVTKFINSCRKGKACGPDEIYYEHVIMAANIVSPILANLFTYMLRLNHVPDHMKRGTIITLHKGNGKSKDNPNNYRAISLTSVILKIYELVLLGRCKSVILEKLSVQQCGFQEKLGCVMTSFILRESVYFAQENKSKLFVCFLDGRQAFDRVWHNGLFYKLCEYGIDRTSFFSIVNMYKNASSVIVNKGFKSDYFPILQGTRQGSKLSPLLYLCFIDGLIKELEKCNVGFCFMNMNLCSPTVADDMILMSFSNVGIQKMLDICADYSQRWRFEYNPGKCGVVVFDHEAKSPQNRTWVLGNGSINEVDQYTHLGIVTDNNLSSKHFVHKACHKLRGTYLSILNSGLHPQGLSPLALKTIYTSVVIPGALYGAELAVYLSKNDLNQLERAHRFCVKNIQSLSTFVNTDFVLCALNLDSMEDMIEYRKLTFIGQLCRLPPGYLAKQVFNVRLVRYFGGTGRCLGFIPDILSLMHKYDLIRFITEYLRTGVFPSKLQWKNVIKHSVINRHRKERYDRLLELIPSVVENSIQFNCESDLWILYRNSFELRPCIISLMHGAGLLLSRKYLKTCCLCSLLCEDIVKHIMCHCYAVYDHRQHLFYCVIKILGTNGYINFVKMSHEQQCEQIVSMAVSQTLMGNYALIKALHKLFYRL